MLLSVPSVYALEKLVQFMVWHTSMNDIVLKTFNP